MGRSSYPGGGTGEGRKDEEGGVDDGGSRRPWGRGEGVVET